MTTIPPAGPAARAPGVTAERACRPADAPGARIGHLASLNLALATLGFLLNFWAWALLGPLAPGVKDQLGLSFAESPCWSPCRYSLARSAGSRSVRSPTATAPG